MSINIIAVNKLKDKNIKSLAEEYIKRSKWKISITEVESKIKDPSIIKSDEANLINNKLEKIANPAIIAMDERGQEINSKEFCQIIENYLNLGKKPCFVIGGAEGLDSSIRDKADKIISFGKMTIPHNLARLLLIEQIYRAWTINMGKSYHK